MIRELTESERTTITNGLRVAAERFQEHVKSFREDPDLTKPAYKGLADQFEKQDRESRELADLIDDCESITLERRIENDPHSSPNT
jgi:hypothetical protein